MSTDFSPQPGTEIPTLIDCPDCGRPAEVVESFVLNGTDGGVPHLRTMCTQRHHFMLPEYLLHGASGCVEAAESAAG